MSTKISIIIPHKNSSNLLERCLSTIPEKEYIQVIIVDDNSDSNIVNFNKFPGINRKNTQVVFNKKSGGAGRARNIGLNFVQGEWILFADADDFFTNKFEELINKYIASKADVVYFAVDSVYSSNIKKEANRDKKLKGFIEKYNLRANLKNENDLRYGFTEPWAKLIKTNLIVHNKITFDETSVSNDYWFSVLIGYHANIIEVESNSLYVVTHRNDSLTNSEQDIEKLKIRIEISSRVYLFLKLNNINYEEPFTKQWLWILLKINVFSFFSTYFSLLKKDKAFLPMLFKTLLHGYNQFLLRLQKYI
ncbi:glycosyltransferase family 2 protein [Anaerophaga thermohalophila]|uniref:glycosyltransferase family 2 protein n=1 Tax=Anaerophaga thermohalophila TaxID=177400 RepID=UPI000237CDFE|nr:glycosyltransferase family 2 protein [Anaerophaga thermohalophila]